MSESLRATVVVPTLNEADNIDLLLGRLLEAGRKSGLSLDVIVVDDGSTDGTRERVLVWEKEHPVRLLARERDRGLAGAVLAGAAAASADVVVVMDADSSHPPEKVADLARPVLEGSADMAVGSRYVPGGGTPGWPLRRRFISRGASFLARILTDVRDPMSGFFALRRSVLLEAGKEASGFKICLQVLASSRPDFRVVEVPITFIDRTAGESKMRGAVMLAYLRQLVALCGGAVSTGSALRFGAVGLLGVFVDLGVFNALLAAGSALALAHVASFSVATVTNYLLNARWAFAREPKGPPALNWRGYLGFLFIAVLALLLRGGVLAFSNRTLGLPAGVGIIAAIIAAAVVNYLGCAFFVFSPTARHREPAISWRLAAVGVALYLLALRLAYAGSFDLMPQEAYYWNYSQHLDIGYLDHPPMVAWLIRLGTMLFGDTELGVRCGAMAASLASLTFGCLLARNLLGRSQAFGAILLLAALPFFFGTGFLMSPDAPLVACWAGALYFLERALLGEKRAAWWGVGVCLGLGLLSKYTIALVGVAALVYIVIDRRSRRWLLAPEPYGAVLLAFAIFSPVILWNLRHDWASFTFQGPRRWTRESVFELHVLLGGVLLLITPLGLAGFVEGLRRAGKEGACKAMAGKLRLFGIVFTCVPLAVFVTSSMRNETKLNWTGPLWIAAVPFMALSIAPATRGALSLVPRMVAASWKPLLVILILGYGVTLHYVSLGIPGFPRREGALAMGWRELGRLVEEVENEVILEEGREPLIVGLDKYYISSAIAFYDPNKDGAHETAGWGLFGWRSLMYDFWFPPEACRGRSLVLVSEKRSRLESPVVAARVEELDAIREILVRREGTVVGRYYYRVAHGYRGRPDR